MKPSRRITNSGGRKNIGRFTSLKMQDDFWYESHAERDYMYLLEIDPEVISYKSQPFKIAYLADGKERKYTPDLFVERKTKQQVVEVKPKSKVDTEKNLSIFRQVTPICNEQGWEFIVVTDQMIQLQPKLDNIKLLYDYCRTPFTLQDFINCKNYFSEKEKALLKDVDEHLSSLGIDRRKIFRALYFGILEADLMQPLGSESLISNLFSQVDGIRLHC